MKKILGLLIVLLLVPITTSAQIDYCEGNFVYDDDQDGSDAFTFKEDFGRSPFGNPCPPDGPAPVAKTGQTISEFPGDDAWWGKGIPWPNPRFIDNSDGTITDNLTGLIWMENANCFGTRTWDYARQDCISLTSGSCGLSDGSDPFAWRLPNVKELHSLINYGRFLPALPVGHLFLNVQYSNSPGLWYWTGSDYIAFGMYRWAIDFSYGEVDRPVHDENHFVWCVRGGH